MEPWSRSLYVTLLSNTSKPEFPHNTPASFKVRLPYPLRVKNWQVGVAGVYLPGPPNTVSHGVTSHPVTTTPVAPLTEHRQSNLFKGSTIAGITHTNTVTTVYKHGGEPEVYRTSSRLSTPSTV